MPTDSISSTHGKTTTSLSSEIHGMNGSRLRSPVAVPRFERRGVRGQLREKRVARKAEEPGVALADIGHRVAFAPMQDANDSSTAASRSQMNVRICSRNATGITIGASA